MILCTRVHQKQQAKSWVSSSEETPQAWSGCDVIYLFHESTSNVLIGVVVKSIVRIGFIAGDTVAHLCGIRRQEAMQIMLKPTIFTRPPPWQTTNL